VRLSCDAWRSYATGLAILGCLAARPSRAEIFDFQIRCNGNPVGHHTVQVREHDGQMDVNTDVSLDVSLAGIDLYHYRYSDHEHWEDGKLVSLESTTNDDGDKMHVSVHRDIDGDLLIESGEGVKKVPGDTLPASYWNPAVLAKREVIDNQSGKLLKVSIKPLSEGRYDVTGDVNFEVDYRQGRWAGLRFKYIGADVDYQRRTQLTNVSDTP
jgi:hypothetical protein